MATALQSERGGGSADTLRAVVPAGKTLKPWLALGPFYEDFSAQVQGLTLFERAGSPVGTAAMADVAAAAQPLLTGAPVEGEAGRFLGQRGRWTLARRPEPYFSWGTYNISNHLGAIFLSTRVALAGSASGSNGAARSNGHTETQQPATQRWTLVTRISSRVLVALDGEVVFDTGDGPFATIGRGRYEYHFETPLTPGDHTLNVAVFRLARMAQVGFALSVDTDVEMAPPLHPGVDGATRQGVEAALGSLALERDLFHGDQPATLRLGSAPPSGAALHARLVKPGVNRETNGPMGPGETAPPADHEVAALTLDREGQHTLVPGGTLSDGVYRLEAVARTPGGEVISAVEFALRVATPTPAPAGYGRLAERKRLTLEHYARTPDSQHTHSVIWPAVAQYALGQPVDEDLVRWVAEFIAARKDCADFAIQGLLRLLYWERAREASGESFRLSAGLRALMKDTVLGFKYWVDEPGDTVMYMGSENHRLLFHVAEWLAGQLYPLDEFSNSRQRGLYHATKGRMYITEWLRQRGRYGFDEWHSNSYFPIDIAPLLNVYDFAIAEDAKLRQMAGGILDYLFFILAADSYGGVLGTTHGRSYGIYVKYPELDGTGATCWTLFGTGYLVHGTSGMSPVSIATSRYVLPEVLARIAADREATVESRQRQGILSGSERHAEFVVFRTPDYLMSGLQDHRKGEHESSTHVAQVTLGGGAPIFWSCPETIGEGSGLRPDYWSGHTVLPRVVQHRNVLSLTWRLSEYAWMTHCYFEPARFDEVRFADAPGGGRWAFARVGGDYAGIWSQGGFEVGRGGQFAGRELVCTAARTTWLCECGRAADWGSFDAFVEALTQAPIEVSDGGETVAYRSPSIGTFVTGWDVTPTVDGGPVALRGYPLVESAWAQSRFGSGDIAITYGDTRHELWLNQ